MQRGMSSCQRCQGTGRVVCNACQGAGILQPAKVAKMNQLRHATNKLVSLGKASPSMHDADWLVSNRCKRCRGSGAVECVSCQGSGKRGPQT